jgi:hypothetical protein
MAIMAKRGQALGIRTSLQSAHDSWDRILSNADAPYQLCNVAYQESVVTRMNQGSQCMIRAQVPILAMKVKKLVPLEAVRSWTVGEGMHMFGCGSTAYSVGTV